jgi:hypothetical protein
MDTAPKGLVPVLIRCGLPLPTCILANEKHSHCRANKVYLPTVVNGRLIWHLGYTEDKSAAAFAQSYGVFQQAPSGRSRPSIPGVCRRAAPPPACDGPGSRPMVSSVRACYKGQQRKPGGEQLGSTYAATAPGGRHGTSHF